MQFSFQSVWRKVQNLIIIEHFENDIEIRKHIKMCASLAYLPPESAVDGWHHIMEHAPSNDMVEVYNDYFVGQWMENDIIGDMWNCHNQKHKLETPKNPGAVN